MKLSEIFDQLSYGELAQMEWGGDPRIVGADFARVASAVNLGLTDLHKRFRLKTGQVGLALQLTQTRYCLSYDYATSNPAVLPVGTVKYVVDDDDPIQDDILKIERIFDKDDKIVPLNDEADEDSVKTVDYRTLVLPEAPEETGIVYQVHYRKNHVKLTSDDWDDPEWCEISLPDTHLEALLLYVASRLLTPLGASASGNHDGNNYMIKYEQAVQMLMDGGMYLDREYTHPKFATRGWV